MKNILKKVKSPFTDELIQDLIKRYISCGCDDDLFYDEINNLRNIDIYDNHFTNELENQIKSKGIHKQDIRTLEKRNQEFIYDDNNDWIILYSEEDPMKDNKIRKNTFNI